MYMEDVQIKINSKLKDIIISTVISVSIIISVCLVVSPLIGSSKKKGYLAFIHFLELSHENIEANIINCK